MASSGRLEFDKVELRERLMTRNEERLEAAQLKVTHADDPEYFAQQVAKWRVEAEGVILDAYRKIVESSMQDAQLSGLTVQEAPEHREKWEIRRTREKLKETEQTNTNRLARLDAMKASPEGTVFLTITQMCEWLGL